MQSSEKSIKLRSEFIMLLNKTKSNSFDALKVKIHKNENKNQISIMQDDLVHNINKYDNIHESYGGCLPLDPLYRNGSVNVLSSNNRKSKPYVIPSTLPSFHAYLLYQKDLQDRERDRKIDIDRGR